MRFLLFVLVFFCSLYGQAQDAKRAQYVDSLIKSNKYKVLKKLTARDEQKVIVAYAKSNTDDRLWWVTEQRLTTDGYESSKTTRYFFRGDEVLMAMVTPRHKECRKCTNFYYFSDGKLVQKREETTPQDIDELLVTSAKYSLKASFIQSR
jgi:hypothetical protein